MIERAIVYPLKYPGGSQFNNLELRYSLRSIEKHLKDNVPIYIISAKKPDFLNENIRFIEEDGYMKAMEKACDIAKEIVWWNDDIYLIKDIDWEYLRLWRRSTQQVGIKQQKQRLKSTNGWSANLGKVIERLRENGLTTYSYVSHSPYMYDTEKLREIIPYFNFGYKSSIETAYGNIYDPPLRKSGDKILRYNANYFWGDIGKNKYMLNHDNAGFTPSLRYWLQTQFPNKCKYEVGYKKPELAPQKRAGG